MCYDVVYFLIRKNISESVGLSNEDKKNPGKVLEAMESFSKG